MSNTLNTLIELVSQKFDKNIDELGPETTLESLGIDSPGKIELIFDLEDHFKVRIPNEDAKVDTLGEVAALLDAAKPIN
ncbi:acyl carrier protein [Polynucleobacter necessarius]|uniref:acyl carrier protein n=1 Tax=Polynucleobacter necessarius TaxID=576610 RepID=UPI000E08F0DA|nr:phosphopantetheine-binding protein [Polynucleobacter necessarius]